MQWKLLFLTEFMSSLEQNRGEPNGIIANSAERISQKEKINRRGARHPCSLLFHWRMEQRPVYAFRLGEDLSVVVSFNREYVYEDKSFPSENSGLSR